MKQVVSYEQSFTQTKCTHCSKFANVSWATYDDINRTGSGSVVCNHCGCTFICKPNPVLEACKL